MPRTIHADGRLITVPDDATPDEINEIVGPAPAPPQQGFFSSAADSSGLSTFGNALMHPLDTARNIAGVATYGGGDTDNPIINGLKGMVANTTDNVKKGIDSYRQSGMSQDTRRAFGKAVPIVGPILAKAQEQHDAGNDAGMAGTLAGAAASFAAPEALGRAIPKMMGGTANATGKAMQIAGASGDSLKLAGARILAPGGVGETLIRATKPAVKYGPAGEIAASYENTLPLALAENPNIGSVAELGKAYEAAKDTNHAGYVALRAPHMELPIDTTPLVGDQVASIPATNKFETPGIVGRTAARANPYDMTPSTQTSVSPILDEYGKPYTSSNTVTPTKPTLGTVDEIRSDTNAKLNSFYNKEGGDQAAALSNPETARLKAVNDGSRDLVYKALADANGISEDAIRAHQQMYGELSDAGNAANKRGVVFDRQDPVTLAQKIAASHGGPIATAFNFGKEQLIQSMTNSDGLVRSAVDRFRNPSATPLAPGGSLVQRGMFNTGTAIRPSVPLSPINPAFLPVPLMGTRRAN